MKSRRILPIVIGAVTVVVIAVGVVLGTRSGDPAPATAADATEATQEFGAVGTTETVPCPESLPQGAAFTGKGDEVEGQTYSCGVVVVPVDHENADDGTIEIFYLKLHSSSGSPAADPLVYLAGGPGSSGSYELTSNPLLLQNLDEVRKTRDILAYDQRGTGYSNYLLCAPFESTLGILRDRDRNPQIGAAIADLQKTAQGTGYAALRANLCGVGSRLLAGVDLGRYNSVASAQDIPILTQALGYTGGYDLYGTSYGTRLAQYAMRQDPDGVRSVILDGASGTATPNVMWSITKNVEAYVSIIDRCAADPACAAAYPDLDERFGALLDKLEKDPLVLDPPLVVNPALTVSFPPVLEQIDADFFLQLAYINNIAVGGGFAASVPAMIKAAEEGDTQFFRDLPALSASAADAAASPQTAAPTGAAGATPVLTVDQPLFQVPFVTLLSLAQTAAAQPQPSIDTQWLSVALGDLAARLQAGEDQDDLMEALLRLAVVPNIGTTAQDLVDYANANLSPSAAKAANAIARKMTRNEARATMWSIQDVAMALGTEPDKRAFSDGMGWATNCAEDMAFSSLDDAKTNLAQSPYPQLASFPLSASVGSLASCASYPTPLDSDVTDPVVSDIPALVFVGQLDIETPPSWGRDVAEGLSRSTVVEWENQGHVAAAHDPALCPGRIAAAFLEDPSAPPDVACAQTDDYTIDFVVE